MVDKLTPKWDANGLLTAVVQDVDNGEVLMVAYMNEEALRKTRDTGLCHFWSRSRRKLWLKGEQSGHTIEVVEILVDCDQDALLVRGRAKMAACHLGYRSCFHRRLGQGDDLRTIAEKVFDPDKVY